MALLKSLLALAAVATSLLAQTASAASSAGCGKAPTLTGTSPYSLTVNNKQRQYYIKLPPSYNNTHPYKLIFTFHALGGQASQVVAGTGGYLPWYGLPALDTGNTAVYIAPNGLNQGWGNTGGEDLLFTDAMIKTVEADLCVDTAHRYSTGFSYGASMSYAIACARAKDFKAVAVLSGGPMSGCTGGKDPIAWYNQHGVSDQVLPFALGTQMRDQFVANNGCAKKASVPAPAKGSGTHIKTVFEDCKYPTTFVAFDGPHTPQPMDKGASKTFSADESWAFFQQFKQE
ncbi:Rhodanese-like domain-containing protein [Apiospora arundinis]